MFAENEKKDDSNAGMGNFDKEKRFMHTFIISNIKVIARQTSIIKYQIDIVSNNWMKCAANLSFSNYGEKPWPLFDIIKTCFSKSKLAIDEKTFIVVRSPVELNYIT